jgi:hypothetical protein
MHLTPTVRQITTEYHKAFIEPMALVSWPVWAEQPVGSTERHHAVLAGRLTLGTGAAGFRHRQSRQQIMPYAPMALVSWPLWADNRLGQHNSSVRLWLAGCQPVACGIDAA